MSYLTLEVSIDHGKVLLKEPEKLPETGTGLLTILQPTHMPPPFPPRMWPWEAFKVLQQEMALTPEKAEAWKAAMLEARR